MKEIIIQKEIKIYPNNFTVIIRAEREEDDWIVECFDLDEDVSFYCEKQKELSGFESYEEAIQALREDKKEVIKDKLNEVREMFEQSYQVTFAADEYEWHVNDILNFYIQFVNVNWDEEDDE